MGVEMEGCMRVSSAQRLDRAECGQSFSSVYAGIEQAKAGANVARMRAWIAAFWGTLLVACSAVEGPLLVRSSAPSDAAIEGGGGAGPNPDLPIAQNMSWQYQLSGELDLDVDAQLFVIDLFELDAAEIAALHAEGKVLVAYLSAGTRESFRADADDFPDSVIGNTHPGYPNESWLDVRAEAVRAVMAARLDLARDKGFDGLVPTSLSSYRADTGFDLTAEDLRAYSAWLAAEAHARGLYVAMTDDFEQVQLLAGHFDWAIHFGCIARGDCNELDPFVAQGKPVLDVEFEGEQAQVCAAAAALGLNVLIKRPQFDAFRVGCL
jgi:hypothetical protein